MNLANLITMLRFPLLLLVVALLYVGGSVGQLVDVGLIALLILMDSLDGDTKQRWSGVRWTWPPTAQSRSCCGWSLPT